MSLQHLCVNVCVRSHMDARIDLLTVFVQHTSPE